MHVGTDLFAQIGHLVDVGDLHRKKGVARIFDQLRRLKAGHQDRGLEKVERPVEGTEHILRTRGLGPDDHAVGPHEIADGGAFAKKLRIGCHVEIGIGAGIPDDGFDLAARSHRHGRFRDNDGIAGQVTGKLARGVEHIGQVGMPVPAPGGRSNRDEHGIRIGDSRPEFGCEMQPAGRDVACHKVLEARLIDRHHTRSDAVDLAGILVDTGDVEAEFGKTGARHKTDITGSNNCQLHMHLLRFGWRNAAGPRRMLYRAFVTSRLRPVQTIAARGPSAFQRQAS